MADTETTAAPEAIPDTTSPGPVKDSQAEENNNSDKMPPPADNPADTEEPTPAESTDKDSQPDPVMEQDSSAQQEADQQEQPSAPADGEETKDAPVDAPQETEEEPKKEDEPTVNGQDVSAEPHEQKTTAEENTDKEVEGDVVEETPTDEQQVQDDSGKVEEEAPATAVEADDAVAPKEDDEKPEGVEASPTTDEGTTDQVPEVTPEKVADETDDNAPETDNITEQQADVSSLNENEKKAQDDVVVEDEDKDTNKEPSDSQAKDEVDGDAAFEKGAPEDVEVSEDDAPVDDGKQEVEPEPQQEPPKEAQVEDAPQPTSIAEAEPAEPISHEPTTYEEKLEAAQRDIRELRALNVEIKQRLENSDGESKERHRQASVDPKAGMKVQADYLARELSQQQDTEKYLRQKLAETLEEKEESERKCKDMQLRLKRFAKDDQAKDERMAKLETELRDVSRDIQVLEEHFDEETLKSIKGSKGTGATNGQATTTRTQTKSDAPVPQSKTCTIL